MNKLASTIIDFYDDPEGSILKSRFPTAESLPDIIKEGTVLPTAERERLRDSLFALVLTNGDEEMKKFACTDACNTALSIIYLLDHAKEKLPEAATKTAAQNLLVACKTYDLKPPADLEKLAGLIPPEVNPYIDVTSMEGPKKEKAPSMYCLKKEAKYPIQTYDQILEAVAYFEKHASNLHPQKRREFCLNIIDRADELAIPVGEHIRKYAAEAYADKGQIRGEIYARIEKTASDDNKKIYAKLFEKIASVSPGVFANMLMQIDEETGMAEYWDGALQDPYSATLTEKTAGYAFSNAMGYVDEEDLRRLSEYSAILEHAFDADFAKAFKSDPVTQFKALPEPQKNTVIKLVAAAKKW